MNVWNMPAKLAQGTPVITVDPGLRTGLAILSPDGTVSAAEGEWDETITAVRDAMQLFVTSGFVPVVVVERFTINAETTKKSSDTQWPLEAIGAIRWLARRHALDLTMQMPVEAKRFATNNRLKAIGWYISTPGGHVNDALRHLYLYLATHDRLDVPAGVI